MAVIINPQEGVSDYARTALETALGAPPLFTVEGELGRPNINVNAPVANTNRLLVLLAVVILIYFLFFRRGK